MKENWVSQSINFIFRLYCIKDLFFYKNSAFFKLKKKVFQYLNVLYLVQDFNQLFFEKLFKLINQNLYLIIIIIILLIPHIVRIRNYILQGKSKDTNR